jgi:DNA-binding CsgD family transcriptional regulator
MTTPRRPTRIHMQCCRDWLTPAEARVAAGLAMGERLPSVTRRLGVSLNTARTLLSRTTAKLQVESQLELVRTILTSVPQHGLSRGSKREAAE